MYTNVFLQFSGRCREAFAFYAATFHSEIGLTMTYAEAPGGSPVPQEFSSMIMHTSMPLGPVTLMGCDSPKAQPMGGFRISIDVPDDAEVASAVRGPVRGRFSRDGTRPHLLVAALRHGDGQVRRWLDAEHYAGAGQ